MISYDLHMECFNNKLIYYCVIHWGINFKWDMDNSFQIPTSLSMIAVHLTQSLMVSSISPRV
jgi:hypothetical protein